MLSGESPKMLFDIIMTRFEEDYNPKIIYDASCKVLSIYIDNVFQVGTQKCLPYAFMFYRSRNMATIGS